MSDSVSAAQAPPRLPADPLRSIAAVVVAALQIAGWVFVALQPELRASVDAQGTLWWAEQLLWIAQTIFCVGVVLERPASARGAFILTGIAVAAELVDWLEAFRAGHLKVPVTGIANVILLWRLAVVLRMTPATIHPPAG